MLPAHYLMKIPYSAAWMLHRRRGTLLPLVAYCADPLDVVVLAPVIKHLPPLTIAAKNRKTMAYLKKLNIPYKRLPVFPKAVIMARHAAHRFPVKAIQKFGFRHGAYHFKAFAGTKYYNQFDVYFMTSSAEVKQAEAIGITTAMALGFPKLDPAFDCTWIKDTLNTLAGCLSLDPQKKNVLFTATWDRHGMSAVHLWAGRIAELADQYNVLVTVHPWMSGKVIKLLKRNKRIHFIQDPDILPYLMLSHAVIGDTSSILAEACALDKPMITFTLPPASRTVPEITDILDKISIRVAGFDGLPKAIEACLQNPAAQKTARQNAAHLMFERLDGKAGQEAAGIIKKIVKIQD